jgi:TetR/AcrR family transcriptional repressor of nem operon
MQPLADTQQRILDSAHELFYSRSYADVGVAAICEHAGVKKGSFYHYFPSKRELTLAVVDKYYADLKEHFIDKAFADDLPPLARLERLAEIAYQFQKQIMHDTGRVLGCPFGNLATELSTQDEIIRTKLQRVFAKLQTQFRHVLQDAQHAGELRDLDVAATAHAMVAYFEGVMLLAKNQNDPEVIRTLLPTIAQIRIYQR